MVTLRAARKASGYSAKDIARYLKISTGTVYKYERNSDSLRIAVAVKLLDLYNLPMGNVQFRKN